MRLQVEWRFASQAEAYAAAAHLLGLAAPGREHDAPGLIASCGVGEDQWEGFTVADPGARVSVREGKRGRWRVFASVPVSPADAELAGAGGWFSPALLPDNTEAARWRLSED